MKIKERIKERKNEVVISLISLGVITITMVSTKNFLKGFEKGFTEKLKEVCGNDIPPINYKRMATPASIQMMNNIIDVAKDQGGILTEEQLALLDKVKEYPWGTIERV